MGSDLCCDAFDISEEDRDYDADVRLSLVRQPRVRGFPRVVR